MGSPNVRSKYRRFDIYVRSTSLHDATRDRVQYRTHLIAKRLKEILLGQDTVCRIRYRYGDEYDLWTKMIGYQRYHIYFAYRTTI